MESCLACELTEGTADLPGGRILATERWVVEHCVGPLGVGTLIVKPVRHCIHFWELNAEEAADLGPLLRQVTATISEILQPDQVFVCLWSFAGWEAGHLHFVLQPAWSRMQEEHEHPGPCLQRDMFHANQLPPPDKVEAFATRARETIGSHDASDKHS